ncbi:unnamed protein product [Candidula unifasciata]|uniref:Uncharacterized protein n=1 Tax=Candidula unifasciata TaxID=100452 RepID=A0A8S3ZN62_9EUPU|nr:unnamed protein product [Candidula unifasciata]
MLSMTLRDCRMLTLALLMLCLGSEHAAFLTNERGVIGNATNETISLPDNFHLVLSLKGAVNQFDANITFNKLAFETLYGCLCLKDTYSCSGNVTFIYGTGYNYNTDNITRVPTNTAATMSTIYKCDIPNFGFLSNNRGGHFTCTRAVSAESECTTSYWSVYIGQCDLGSANVIWNPSHQATWKYTSYKNNSKRDIISSLLCSADTNSSYVDTTLVTSPNDLITSPRDGDTTTNVLTTATTTNPTQAHSKSDSNEGAVIGGAVAAVVVFTTLFVAGVVWSCILFRKKKKDMSTLVEQSKQNNRKPLPDIPTRNSKPARLYGIPELGIKPEDIPRCNHSRRKDDDDTISSIYDVIGSGVYENDISINGNTSIINNNNRDEKDRANNHVINNNTNNKSPFGSCTSFDKAFSLTVTNGDFVPGYSKLGSKDNNIHNAHNQLQVPKPDMKRRQRQPIPTEESLPGSQDSTGQESSGFSLGRYFQENYNFLNRPAEIRREDNPNNKLDVPSEENNGKQNNTRNSELVYPANNGEYGSDGTPYFKVDKYGFPYDSIESGGTFKSEDSLQGSLIEPRDSQSVCYVSISDRSICK